MQSAEQKITRRLVDSLYTEAMLLADEARSYFDEHGRSERDALDPIDRVGFTCESLKVTTRLMHVIAWLLTHRAVDTGEITADQARAPARRLGFAADTDERVSAALPPLAGALIVASCDLYARVHRLDERLERPPTFVSPARGLLDRLERAF